MESYIWLNEKEPEFDIGIVGIWLVKNYGNNLTYYALYHCIKDLGYSPLLIERSADAPVAPEYSTPPLFKKCPFSLNEMSKIYPDRIAMKELNDKCKMFIVGSDQLLYQKLYYLFGRHINLSWVEDKKPKLAYAISLGHDDATAEIERNDKAYYFSKFDAFSVREPSALNLVKKNYNIIAQCVLDPVFICNRKHFDDLLETDIMPEKKKYIGAYILNPSEYKIAILSELSQILGLPLRVYGDADHDVEYSADKSLTELGILPEQDTTVEAWLTTLTGSSLFITDSYHGMCMSIIYHVPFIVFQNIQRGSTRFEHLIKLLQLDEHVLFEGDKLSDTILHPIDFENVDRLLKKERDFSLLWLKNALDKGSKINKARSTFDIMDRRCDDLTYYCRGLEKHCHGLQQYCDNLNVYQKELSEKYQKLLQETKKLTEEFSNCQSQNEKLSSLIDVQKEQMDNQARLLINLRAELDNNFFFKFFEKIQKLFRHSEKP